MKKPFVLGITGGSASGKTLFIRTLSGHFEKEEICIFSQDNYYKSISEQPVDKNGIVNFDTPDSVHLNDYAVDLQILIAGKIVQRTEYTYNNASKTPGIVSFIPAPLIIVEGIFAFQNKILNQLFDLKVYLDTKEELKLKRRIERDRVERACDEADVRYRYENHIVPTFEKYIAPCKDDADIVIENNESGFDTGLKMLVKYLKSKLK